MRRTGQTIVRGVLQLGVTCILLLHGCEGSHGEADAGADSSSGATCDLEKCQSSCAALGKEGRCRGIQCECLGGSDADADAANSECKEVDCGEPYVRFVDVDVPSAGDGLSWQTAFKAVQDGIESASLCRTCCPRRCDVWVADGRYFIYRNDQRDTVRLQPGVRVYGGFAGAETSVSERDWSRYPTILDGRKAGEKAGYHRVVHVVTGSDDAEINGFTITGGYSKTELGGGMYNSASSPIVANCVFTENTARGGAGMANDYSSPTVSGCTFSRNNATAGGGMYNTNEGEVTVSNCAFTENSGGAIHNDTQMKIFIVDSTFTGNDTESGAGAISSTNFCSTSIEGSTFVDNRGHEGGAVYSEYLSYLSVTDSTFSGNSAESGGAIYADHEMVIINSLFEANMAEFGGGVYLRMMETGNIQDSRFLSNIATFDGGGLYWDAITFPMTDTVFWNNQAQYGAAISLDTSSEILLYNCTIAGNRAEQSGGGIETNSSSMVTIVNSILWGDTPGEIEDYFPEDPVQADVSYSDVAAWDGGVANIDQDPRFEDAKKGLLRLAEDSPCIDAADGTQASDTDIEGSGRVDAPQAENRGNGPPWVDMGAYEYHPQKTDRNREK